MPTKHRPRVREPSRSLTPTIFGIETLKIAPFSWEIIFSGFHPAAMQLRENTDNGAAILTVELYGRVAFVRFGIEVSNSFNTCGRASKN